MLGLHASNLADKQAWEAIGVTVPDFDYAAMRLATAAAPTWVHIGPGNIFRGFVAALQQKMLELGKTQSGITAVATFDYQIMDLIYKPYDDLALQVIMHADGTLDKTIIASVGESLKAEKSAPADWARLQTIFSTPELQMVSFTITEKGYHIRDMHGAFTPDVVRDLESGPAMPENGMSLVTSLLHTRYKAGKLPVAMVSMDNFSHNGDKLFDSVITIATTWRDKGFVDAGFIAYLHDRKTVSFPWSMIDKITPRPSEIVSKILHDSGFESTEVVITDKHTYIAPFVNTEGPQYLVIEESFPNGRPPLELAGVYFTDRTIVDVVERMKVCTCLNPLHTSMAIFGCLLGYTSIAEEMNDPCIARMVTRIGHEEGMPVVADPKILDPMNFLREVIEVRLPNPFIPDTPQRIATDTSQKLGIRFGETIKLYMQRRKLSMDNLICIPLTLAGWCRYLMAVDDEGKPMQLSPDPLLEQVQTYLASVKFGDPSTVGEALRPILSNTHIFGTDLYAAGLGERIEGYFARMIAGPGAVRATLTEEVL